MGVAILLDLESFSSGANADFGVLKQASMLREYSYKRVPMPQSKQSGVSK